MGIKVMTQDYIDAWPTDDDGFKVFGDCGRVLKSSDALHCFEAITKDGRNIYGADICKDCLPQFDKKELKGRAK